MHVDGLVGRHFPIELGEYCLRYGRMADIVHMEALGARSPELSHELIVSIHGRRDRAVALALPALLAAMDAGGDAAQLGELWASLRPADLEEDAIWANGEIRRLSRTDLSAAASFRQEVLGFHDEDFDAALAFFSRLARREGESALRVALGEHPPGAIALPRLTGCALGGVIFADAMHEFLGDLDKNGYAPHLLFRHLVEFCLRNELPELLARVLKKGGAHGWQVAQAAGSALRLPAVRESDKAATMLALLLEKHHAGPVAGRDASDNRPHAGQCEYRPAWLDFEDPKPVEWLGLMAALEDDAPWWSPLR